MYWVGRTASFFHIAFQKKSSRSSNRWFSFGKSRRFRALHLGYRGAESPGWFDVSPKTLHETWCVSGALSWKCQSLVAHSCGLLNHLNSFCRGMFKLNAKFDADLLLSLFSHFECYGRTVHRLTQWHLPSPLTSTVMSSLFKHVAFQSTLLDCQVTSV